MIQQIEHLPLGMTVRLRDTRLAIVLQKPFVCCDAKLQMIQGLAILEVPAICTTCSQSHWYWGRDVLPKCRVCSPPPANWEFELTAHAFDVMKQLDDELAEEEREWMSDAFVSGDVDSLQRIVGLQIVQEELRKTYSKYFERKTHA